MNKNTKQRIARRHERGYIVLIVIVILMVLLTAAAYSLRAADTELRSSTRFRRSELLGQAADAGAAQRISEIALASQPAVILDDQASATYATWTQWPAPNQFTSTAQFPGGAGPVAISQVDGNSLSFRTGTIRMNWAGKTPPPGVAVGTPTYIFEFTSFATMTGDQLAGGVNSSSGEAAIAVSVKSWDSLPSSYGP
jgi:hypothetical protein